MSRFFSAVRASGEGRHLYAPVVVICVALLAQAAGLLDPLDRWLGDLRFRIGERPASGQIVIADIDSRSLHEIGTWPWPRSIHAELIDRLRALGAAEIALDIDFSTASNPSDDAALEAALARAGGSVILASFAQSATGQSGDPRLSYNVPIAPFLANAWTAAVNVLPDADGKVRDLPLGAEIEGAPTQSLAAMLANFAAPASGQFPVDFSIRPETVDRISIIDVLRGKVDPSRIGGKKVIVGANAVELHDLFQVPVYSIISGSLLQALGAETLIQGRLLASAGAFLTIVVLVLIVFACALIYRGVRWVAFLGCLAVMSVGIEFGAGLAQLVGLTILHTAVWQVALAGFAVFAIGSEIDFRRILLLISRTETRNVRRFSTRSLRTISPVSSSSETTG